MSLGPSSEKWRFALILRVIALALSIVTFASTNPVFAQPSAIWKDASDDIAGLNAVPGVTETGFDLVAGRIERAGSTLVFSVEHSKIPAFGHPSEAFRFIWHFDLGRHLYRFTFKSVDIGKPDALAGNGSERLGHVYADGVVRLERQYADGFLPLQLEQFKVLDYLDATVDGSGKTVTWRMPLRALKLKSGVLLRPGTGGSSSNGCQICWIHHVAERSFTSNPNLIIDSAVSTVPYRIP